MADLEQIQPQVRKAGDFVANDPRIWKHGAVPSAVLAARKLLVEDAPKARDKLRELLASEDERIQLMAATEILRYGLGPPKYNQDEVEQQLREKFSEAFAKAKERLDPVLYAKLVEALR